MKSPLTEQLIAEIEARVAKLKAEGWTQADFANQLGKMLLGSESGGEPVSYWCEACRSYHVDPTSREHHKALQCKALRFFYIKNGKSFVSESPIYFFEWVYPGGTVTFGFHGTEAEYLAASQLDKMGTRELRVKRELPQSN